MTIVIKAPAAMIDAVNRVSPEHRLEAAKMAEAAFSVFLKKLSGFDDFGLDTDIELAAEAAAAEVLYYFN